MAKASNTQRNEKLEHAPTPAIDLIDAAVWPGRINRNGTRAIGFIYDARYQHIIERLTINGVGAKYHSCSLPEWLRKEVGFPSGRKGRSVGLHQLVFRLQWNRWPECAIDHIYGTQDNRACSLRLITSSGNRRNRQTKKTNGLPWGVVFDKKQRKYKAKSVDATGKQIHLGSFTDIQAAAAAVDLFNAELIAEDERLSDLMTRGIIKPPKRTLPRGVHRAGEVFAATIKSGKTIGLGHFPTASLASIAHEAARVIRAAGGTPEEMKKAARDATETSSIELGGCE